MQKTKPLIWKDTWTPMFIVYMYLFACIYACTMEYYSAMKKNTILSIAATQMVLNGIMLQWNKSDRER